MKIENMDVENMSVEELEALTGPEDAVVEEPAVQEPAEEVTEQVEPDVEGFYPENPEVLAAPKSLEEMVRELQEQISALNKAPKNHVEGKVSDKKYVRVGRLSVDGKVPQQQHDLATILTKLMPVGKVFTEAEIFAALNKEYGDYPSLANSRQHVTYLFRYYRGLKRENKHAGFVARGFLRVV